MVLGSGRVDTSGHRQGKVLGEATPDDHLIPGPDSGKKAASTWSRFGRGYSPEIGRRIVAATAEDRSAAEVAIAFAAAPGNQFRPRPHISEECARSRSVSHASGCPGVVRGVVERPIVVINIASV